MGPILPYIVLFSKATSFGGADAFLGDPFPKPWNDPGFERVCWVQSPNFNRRPADAVVDTVVVHATVIPTLEATAGAFFRESSQVSAHFVIGRDGSIVQCVPLFYRAWHAGVSRDSLGRGDLNNFSVGIELVNLDDGKDPFPQPQIDALKAVIRMLEWRFPIKYIASHKYIAIPQGRKIDPNNFPWQKLSDLGLKMEVDGYAPSKPGDPKPVKN